MSALVQGWHICMHACMPNQSYQLVICTVQSLWLFSFLVYLIILIKRVCSCSFLALANFVFFQVKNEFSCIILRKLAAMTLTVIMDYVMLCNVMQDYVIFLFSPCINSHFGIKLAAASLIGFVFKSEIYNTVKYRTVLVLNRNIKRSVYCQCG